jgi:tRNA(Ile)-lysidine synthase
MSPVEPAALLRRSLVTLPEGPLLLALSGGMDSVALAHALGHDAGARARGLRAVHIDHGLHADSAAWAERCAAQCAAWSLPLMVERVTVPLASGRGLEGAAREARYAAIAALMKPGEIVLTAHHADDQAETLMLRLLRGASPGGLAAMRALRPLPPGWLARPWLDVPRDAIHTYAKAHALAWTDDPANADERHLRNYMRHRVLAPLRERVPQAATSLSRSAALLGAADDELAIVADATLAGLLDAPGHSIALPALRGLSTYLRGAVLRLFCERAGMAAPDATALREIDATLLPADDDAQAHVRWRGGGLRAWRARGYPLMHAEHDATYETIAWDTRAPLTLPDATGVLVIEGGMPETMLLHVRPRGGGERIALHPRRPSQSVRTALQSLGVPPWLRAGAPYVWQGDTVLAVGDWLIAHRFAAQLRERGARFVWRRAQISN